LFLLTFFFIAILAVNILCTRHVLLNNAPKAKENAIAKTYRRTWWKNNNILINDIYNTSTRIVNLGLGELAIPKRGQKSLLS
jgi:hypothetical protein